MTHHQLSDGVLEINFDKSNLQDSLYFITYFFNLYLARDDIRRNRVDIGERVEYVRGLGKKMTLERKPWLISTGETSDDEIIDYRRMFLR